MSENASERFISSLQLFDPLLSVRWSSVLSSWVIDRKAYVPDAEVQFLIRRSARSESWYRQEQDPVKKEKKRLDFAGVWEELQSARSGRRVIFFTRQLDRTTFDRLALSDTQRYGGYSRMADEFEKHEKEAAARQDKQHSAQLDDVNREAFDQLNFILDKKHSRIEHGHVRDLKTLLHGR